MGVEELRSIDTSGIEVDDDDQVMPSISVGGKEEKDLLAQLEGKLEGENKGASETLKLICLRGRKYDVDRAAAIVPRVAALLEKFKVTEETQEDLSTNLRSGKLTMPGTADEKGRAIIWVRLRFHDPKAQSAEAFGRMMVRIFTTALENPETARNGVCVVQDMSHVGIKNFDPKAFKMLAQEVFANLPIRIGKVCIYNPPFIIGRVILPIVFSIMPKKLKARLTIVNGEDQEALHKLVPPASLPEELGGTLKFDIEQFAATVEKKELKAR